MTLSHTYSSETTRPPQRLLDPPPSHLPARVPLSPLARRTLIAGKRFIAIMHRDIGWLKAEAERRKTGGYDAATEHSQITSAEAVIASVRQAMRSVVDEDRRITALELALFHPSQPRVPAGNPGGGEWTNGDWSGGTPNAIPAMARRISEKPEVVRSRIVAAAQKQIDSQAWSDGVANGRYGQNTNKCNLFVFDMLTKAGASPGLPNGFVHGYPPTAGQWADPNYVIPGWTVLQPGESPEPGDVAAQAIQYSDASGHVMIVGPNNTLIGTGDRGNGPHGTIEQIPMTDDFSSNNATPSGPVVFRRWRG